MERKVTKLENCHTEVLVTVDEASWKAAQKKAFDKVAANVTVDGFRKGKAPAHLVRSKVDPMKVMDEAINSLIPSLYTEIIEQEGIRPYARPQVDVTKLSDVELEVKFVIVTAPEVKLGKYTGIEVGKEEPTVTEEELNAAIAALQKDNASLIVKEGEAAMGDVVVMDFVGTVDGKEFDGGKAQNYELELGSHTFIPGFEEQLVGKKAGEEVDVQVTFPENYVEELKGKDATFHCTIHEVKSKSFPELNDESVKDFAIPNVETVEQLREYKKQELLTKKVRDAKNTYFGKLIAEIAKTSEVNIPTEIIDSQVETALQNFQARLQQSQLTMKQYLDIVGQTEEDFKARVREDSTRDAVNFFVLDAVGKQENLTVSDEELEFEFAKLADQYHMSIDDVKKALSAQLEDFRHNVQMSRIEDYLYNNNN